MEASLGSQTPQPGERILAPEDLLEIERLEHGINVLDLFTKEDKAEVDRQAFLIKTWPGSDTHLEILEGPAYNRDKVKLSNAIREAKAGYTTKRLRRQAMVEHAAFLNIDAIERNNEVIIENQEDRERLSVEHAKWRTHFGSKSMQGARASYKEFLKASIRRITGEPEPLKAEGELLEGSAVNVVERAILLTRIMNAMSHRSKLTGLGVAIPDEIYNEPIFDRYKERTLVVDQASSNKAVRLLRHERRDFWTASGYKAIYDSGTMKKHLITRRFIKLWNEFAGQFEHAPNQLERVDYREKLTGFIPAERLGETRIDNYNN
jgi:hypothetical protein